MSMPSLLVECCDTVVWLTSACVSCSSLRRFVWRSLWEHQLRKSWHLLRQCQNRKNATMTNICKRWKMVACVSRVEMWRSSSSNSNSTTFECRTFLTWFKIDECFKRFVSNANSLKNPCSTTDFICTENVDKSFFPLKFNPSIIQTTVIEFAT